jgi:hypothetical protein
LQGCTSTVKNQFSDITVINLRKIYIFVYKRLTDEDILTNKTLKNKRSSQINFLKIIYYFLDRFINYKSDKKSSEVDFARYGTGIDLEWRELSEFQAPT